MLCPICLKKIRVVSPCWFKEKTIEACCNCAKKYKLRGIEVQWKTDDGVRYPIWKVQVPAKMN